LLVGSLAGVAPIDFRISAIVVCSATSYWANFFTQAFWALSSAILAASSYYASYGQRLHGMYFFGFAHVFFGVRDCRRGHRNGEQS
jgi:hypothetical protein